LDNPLASALVVTQWGNAPHLAVFQTDVRLLHYRVMIEQVLEKEIGLALALTDSNRVHLFQVSG
jgi:hypothetical protein